MKRLKHSTLSDAKLKALLKGLREDVAAPRDFRAGVLERLRQEGLLADAPSGLSELAPPPSLWARLAALRVPLRGGLALGSALALALVFLIPYPVQTPLPRTAPLPLAGQPVLPLPASAKPAAGLASTDPVPGPVRRQRVSGVPGPAAPASREFASLSVGQAPPGRPPRDGGQATAMPPSVEAHAAVGSESGAGISHAAVFSAAPALSGGLASQLADGHGSAAAPARGGAAGGGPLQPSLRGAGANDVINKPTPTPLTTPTAVAQLSHQNSQVRNNVILASRGQSAQILFTVAQTGQVLVKIYDRMGHGVAVLQNGSLAAGPYSLYWNGTADAGGMAASGIYIVLIQTPTYLDKHKMMLVK